MQGIWVLHNQIRRFLNPSPVRRAEELAKLKIFVLQICRYIANWLVPDLRIKGAMETKVRNSRLQIELSLRLKHYFRVLANYFPKPIDVPILYYSCEHSARPLKRLTSQL